jgi:hypothetical protein
MRTRVMLVLTALLAAQKGVTQQLCEYAPMITSITPSSGLIYPAQYKCASGPCTCTPAAPCTLSDMTVPLFTSAESPPGGATMWSGSSFCNGSGLGQTGLVAPPWWGGQGLAGYCLPDLPYWGAPCPDGYPCIEYSTGLNVFLGGTEEPYTSPTILPAQLGAANNPISGVNVTETGVGQETAFVGNSLPFSLIGPSEMVVVNDFWQYCNGCNSTVQRVTTYKVLNSDGSAAGNIPTGENPSDAGWNCTQTRPTFGVNSCTEANGQRSGGLQSLGMGATNANGTFTDGWSLGSDRFTPAGCGFKVVFDEWQLCGLASSFSCVTGPAYPNYGMPFATLSGAVHSDEVGITINGKSYVIGENICGPLTAYPLCQETIPPGTVINVNSNDAELSRSSESLK